MPHSELAKVAQDLSDQVRRLSQRVTISRRETERVRVLAIGAMAIAVVVFLLAGVSAYLWTELQATAEETRENQVVACKNSNQTKEAQRAAWSELLAVSTASLKAQAAAEGVEPPKAVIDYYRAYARWIREDVFPGRDCSDLSKKVPPIGPPPSFEKALKEAIRDDE